MWCFEGEQRLNKESRIYPPKLYTYLLLIKKVPFMIIGQKNITLSNFPHSELQLEPSFLKIYGNLQPSLGLTHPLSNHHLTCCHTQYSTLKSIFCFPTVADSNSTIIIDIRSLWNSSPKKQVVILVGKPMIYADDYTSTFIIELLLLSAICAAATVEILLPSC